MYLVFSTTLSNSRVVLLKYACIKHEQMQWSWIKLLPLKCMRKEEQCSEKVCRKRKKKRTRKLRGYHSVASKGKTHCTACFSYALLRGALLLLERKEYKCSTPVAKLHANAHKDRFWQFYCMMVYVIVRLSYASHCVHKNRKWFALKRSKFFFRYLCTSFRCMNLELLWKLSLVRFIGKSIAAVQQNNQTKQYIK